MNLRIYIHTLPLKYLCLLVIFLCSTFLILKLCIFSKIKLIIFQIPQSIYAEPYLFPKEKELFYDYLDKSHIYFEYGSSGMIHQAAKRGLTIYSAEVGPAWVSYLKKEIEMINQISTKKVNITYLYTDLQSKISPAYEDFKKYVTLYNHTKYNADLIYINGKYHASCALNIYDQIDSTTVVIIRDIDKKVRNSIKKYYDQITKIQRTFIFKKKNPAPILVKKDLEDVEEKNFNHRGRLINTLTYLRYNFNDTITRYLNYDNEKMIIKPNKKQVWFFWWQGMANAPSIVKLCLSAIKKNLPDGEVTVITNESLPQIIKIPSYVIEKVNNKTMSLNHLSDALRETILSKLGGLWVDATLISIQKVPSEIFNTPFYTIHFDDTFKYVTGKWSGFCQFSYINCIVPKFCSEIFLGYAKKFEISEYFLLDYIMLLGYEFIPAFRRTIEKVPFNNPNVLSLDTNINDVYTPDRLDYLTKDTVFFKSSWKTKLIPEVDGQQTIFGYFLSKYLGNYSVESKPSLYIL